MYAKYNTHTRFDQNLAPIRYYISAPTRDNLESHNVRFEESLYNVEEQEVQTEQIA